MHEEELMKCANCGDIINRGYVHVLNITTGVCVGLASGITSPTPEAQPELPGVESTLEERGKRYGDFRGEAKAIQDIKRILFPSDGPAIDIPDDCRQAAEMIVMKLVRAMRGDPRYIDNWHDMVGYATLVEKRLIIDASWVDRTH